MRRHELMRPSGAVCIFGRSRRLPQVKGPMPQFLFLNNALNNFIQAIQNTWSVVFQTQGIQILLAISAIAFAIYAIQLVATQDVPAFILGFGYTIISLAVLHAVFLYSQQLATGVLNGFFQWGQQTSGMSPNVLTPSG